MVVGTWLNEASHLAGRLHRHVMRGRCYRQASDAAPAPPATALNEVKRRMPRRHGWLADFTVHLHRHGGESRPHCTNTRRLASHHRHQRRAQLAACFNQAPRTEQNYGARRILPSWHNLIYQCVLRDNYGMMLVNRIFHLTAKPCLVRLHRQVLNIFTYITNQEIRLALTNAEFHMDKPPRTRPPATFGLNRRCAVIARPLTTLE